MKLAVLIPDGAGVRNFLIGPFLQQAAVRGSVTAFTQIPDEFVRLYDSSDVPAETRTGGPVDWKPLVPLADTRLTLVVRNALAFAHMHWAKTAAMQYLLRMKFGGSWRTRSAMHAARLGGRLFASERRIRHLDKWHAAIAGRSGEVRHYCRVFEQMKPSMLFCSNQRAGAAVPAVLAAKKLGIPTVAFVFSWDNLSSKGRIAAPFDYYLVWSDLMRRELAHYYPDVPIERVFVVGTPQFDPYCDSQLLWSREEFFRRIGADPSRPLICYSGGDETIYSAEAEYVRILLDLIRAERIKGRPQVILRPTPVDEGRRFEAVRAAYPELIYSPPDWLHTAPGNWTRVLPQRSDVQLLANLTLYSDMNINLASTMTLDFALRDKPVVNVAFDAVLPPPLGAPLWDVYYRFEHYRPVVELGAARFARSSDELADHVNAYLADPSLDRDNRRRFVELEVDGPIGRASVRIVDALAEIARIRSASLPIGRGAREDAVFSPRTAPNS
jgi:hypothetical protein